MILISLGLHERPFTRLLEEMERLISIGIVREKVVIQRGYTKYKVRGAESFDFIDFGKMVNYIKKSSMIITHGGAASIMTSLENNKPTIVVPRRKRLKEHTDDHQMQITKELEKQGRVIAVYDIKKLWPAIAKAKKAKTKKSAQKQGKIFKLISDYINKIEA